MKTIAFTGHRTYANQKQTDRLIREAVFKALDAGYDTFISGMATGVDQKAIRVVSAFKLEGWGLKIIAARPYVKHGRRDPNYDELLAICDEVKIIGDPKAPNYLERDRWMVNNADAVVAVLDGRRYGGTFYTYNYAIQQNKPVYKIDPVELTVLSILDPFKGD